jgi:hypothetical protein
MGARSIIEITGKDRTSFVQDLVTNDVTRANGGLVWAALLTAQGKYLADFFLHETGAVLLLDVEASLAPGLAQRLNMYRLRRDVQIGESARQIRRGTGTPPEGALADPRHPALGWRLYGDEAGEDGSDWDAIRVAHVVPETGIELIPNETFPLEAGFERLNGVDFRKGCYVGQEVTARMKHKTELRKGLARVEVAGAAPPGTALDAGGKEAGALYTQAGGQGIAYLRFDRATGPMQAGAARVTWDGARP